MTLHQLNVFATVAKLRNFTLAADNLRVSQPSVSLLVKSLERELEVKLFEKLGNKVRLTVAGERLLQDTEEILARVEGIRERIDEIKGLKKGKISVGGSSSAATSFLPATVDKFKKQYPGVEVILKIERSTSLEKRLLEGELDLAVMGLAPRSPLLVYEIYREEDVVAIAPPSHPLTKKRSVSLELIAKERLITHDKGTLTRDLVEQRFAQLRLPFAPMLELNPQIGARDAIRSAVASGLGIGFLSQCHVVADVKAGRLKVLNVPHLKLKRPMYIAVHKNRQGSSFVQAFIALLKNYRG
jgi:DNA-binding transcriptional LysR family regulator